MSNYVKATNFTSKDSLASGAALKIVKGAELDVEFNAIQTAVESKADLNSPTFTGTPAAPTAASGTSSTQLATTAFVTTAATAAVPPGVFFPYAGSSAPSGFLLCNGQAVSRTTYSALYAAVGTAYGTGDGSTTFNVPNLVNRLPIGAGDLYAVGATGGSKDAIVVSHTHTATVTDPGHVHGRGEATQQNFIGGSSGAYVRLNIEAASNTESATTGITVANSTTGSSGTGANLPPYVSSHFIIKT